MLKLVKEDVYLDTLPCHTLFLDGSKENVLLMNSFWRMQGLTNDYGTKKNNYIIIVILRSVD